MTDQRISPEKITKPIQLLAAWLVGLFSVNGSFLFAATRLTQGSWEASALVIAAITNVPLFLIALFVLQTKFRPELQEDSYYSTYLNSKTNQLVSVSRVEAQAVELAQKVIEEESQGSSSDPGNSTLKSLDYGICSHLADKDAIVGKLAEIGVLSYTTFGAEEPPKHRCVSISKHLSRDKITKVVSLAGELGFRGYKLYDNVIEDSLEDVLFGSYGEPEFEIVRKTSVIPPHIS